MLRVEDIMLFYLDSWSFSVGCWAWYSSQCEVNLVVFGSSVIVKVSWDVNKTWDYWEQQYPSVVPFTISQYQLQTSLTFDLSLVVTVACFTAVSSQDMFFVSVCPHLSRVMLTAGGKFWHFCVRNWGNQPKVWIWLWPHSGNRNHSISIQLKSCPHEIEITNHLHPHDD